jgi:hypothetical protein
MHISKKFPGMLIQLVQGPGFENSWLREITSLPAPEAWKGRDGKGTCFELCNYVLWSCFLQHWGWDLLRAPDPDSCPEVGCWVTGVRIAHFGHDISVPPLLSGLKTPAPRQKSTKLCARLPEALGEALEINNSNSNKIRPKEGGS